MKKILIFGVAIIIILWYWYSKKEDNGAVSTKSNTSLNMDIYETEKIEIEDAKPLDKRKLYEQEAYEAQVKEQKSAEQSRQDPNVVAYSINSAFEKEKEITIYGAEENKENTKAPENNIQPTVSEKTNSYVPTPNPRPRPQSRRQTPVASNKTSDPVDKADESNQSKSSGFNSVTFNSKSFASPAPAVDNSNKEPQKETSARINAVVFGDHSIKNGEPVKLRLREDAVINGVKVPRNTIFSVPSSFSGRRLLLNVAQIPSPSGQNVATNLKVYDLDNMEGISVNANLEGKVVKREGNNIAGNLISQATGFSMAGNAVNSIFNQMANGEVPIEIPAGHEVTLRFIQR